MPLVLEALAAIVAILGGVFGTVKWLLPGVKKAWTGRKSGLVVVQVPQSGQWTPSLYGNPETGEARAEWHFTNVAEHPIQVLVARLLKSPGDESPVHLSGYLDEEETIPKGGSIWPHQTELAEVIFHVTPQPVVPEGAAFVSDVEFVDSHGKRHRVRRVRFVHRPRPPST